MKTPIKYHHTEALPIYITSSLEKALVKTLGKRKLTNEDLEYDATSSPPKNKTSTITLRNHGDTDNSVGKIEVVTIHLASTNTDNSV